jgi:hypothetical protein
MTGLILLFVLTVWLVGCFLVALLVYKILPKRWWRLIIACAFYFVLVPSPIYDEILGSFEFDQLCKENSKVEFDPLTARGKAVYFFEVPIKVIKGRWVNFYTSETQYRDVETNEIVFRYKAVYSESGKLMRKFIFSDSGTPLRIVLPESCQPGRGTAEIVHFLKESGVTKVSSKSLNQNIKETK